MQDQRMYIQFMYISNHPNSLSHAIPVRQPVERLKRASVLIDWEASGWLSLGFPKWNSYYTKSDYSQRTDC